MTEMSVHNKGFDPQMIREYANKMKSMNQNYLMVESEDNSDDYKNFFFIGSYEGKQVIYDAVIYTLSLHYDSELYELAEERAAKHFSGNRKAVDSSVGHEQADEEFDLYLAEIMMELEEEGDVRVSEHIEIDPDIDFGVGLDIALNVEKVTPQVITRFVKEYNEGTIKLDETLYTFESDDEDEED